MKKDMKIDVFENWNGYTLEEMQYMRAKVLLRKELQKEKLASTFQEMLSQDVIPGGVTGGLTKRLFGKITVVDYLLIGFKLSKTLGKWWKYFHKKN